MCQLSSYKKRLAKLSKRVGLCTSLICLKVGWANKGASKGYQYVPAELTTYSCFNVFLHPDFTHLLLGCYGSVRQELSLLPVNPNGMRSW